MKNTSKVQESIALLTQLLGLLEHSSNNYMEFYLNKKDGVKGVKKGG